MAVHLTHHPSLFRALILILTSFPHPCHSCNPPPFLFCPHSSHLSPIYNDIGVHSCAAFALLSVLVPAPEPILAPAPVPSPSLVSSCHFVCLASNTSIVTLLYLRLRLCPSLGRRPNPIRHSHWRPHALRSPYLRLLPPLCLHILSNLRSCQLNSPAIIFSPGISTAFPSEITTVCSRKRYRREDHKKGSQTLKL